jgi:hypothetical protein
MDARLRSHLAVYLLMIQVRRRDREVLQPMMVRIAVQPPRHHQRTLLFHLPLALDNLLTALLTPPQPSARYIQIEEMVA